MYAIYTCRLNVALNNKQAKTRPVLVVGVDKGKWLVYQITSVDKSNVKTSRYYLKLTERITNGFVNLGQPYLVDSKYFKGKWRDCSITEQIAIDSKLKELNQWEMVKQYRI